MPRDRAAIGAALLARLQGDVSLAALMPGGVWLNRAAPNLTRYVLVTFAQGVDDLCLTFGAPGTRRAIEVDVFAIRACELNTNGSYSTANTKQAAARIDALLEDQPLTITGYVCGEISRLRPIEFADVDQVDKSQTWQYRGGEYRIRATPIPA
jgi:hypothetical protein